MAKICDSSNMHIQFLIDRCDTFDRWPNSDGHYARMHTYTWLPSDKRCRKPRKKNVEIRQLPNCNRERNGEQKKKLAIASCTKCAILCVQHSFVPLGQRECIRNASPNSAPMWGFKLALRWNSILCFPSFAQSFPVNLSVFASRPVYAVCTRHAVRRHNCIGRIEK